MANRDQKIETPWPFFRAVQAYFGIRFIVDLAATKSNTKCPLFIDEAEDDSLSSIWPTNAWCWLNPPFRHLTKWIEKTHESYEDGSRIVTIWPLSGDKNQRLAWQHASVYVIEGRVWPENRSIMMCMWDKDKRPTIEGLIWDRKAETLTRSW